MIFKKIKKTGKICDNFYILEKFQPYISINMNNINSRIHVNFYYLSNKINQRFVAITGLELQAKTFLSTRIKQ